MGLNDKLKGSYYENYKATLASRTAIYNILNELKTYYTDLVNLVNTTYDKITIYRQDMKEKLNAILLKINLIEYNLNNFNYEIDSSIEEKLKKLMENYDSDFVNIVNSYDTNLYNHAKLEDSYSTNDTLYTQPVSEYESSIEKVNTSMGILWFGGKFSDRNLLGKLNNILNIVKINTYENINQEDYINSNLILDIFIYSTKGISWLTLGRNGSFGYNLNVKYHSLRDKDLNIKINSTNYYNKKNYDINHFDLNLLLNLGYKEEDVTNNNIYIKFRTNLPANTYSGLDEYYISNANTLTENNNKRVICNIGKRHVAHNNRDFAYNIGKISNLTEFRNKNRKNDKETDYISDYVDSNYDKTNTFNDANFNIYTDIKLSQGVNNSKNQFLITTKRGNDNKEIAGLNDNIGAITVNANENNEIIYDKAFIGDESSFDNKSDENESVVFVSGKNRINLKDYRNVGKNIGLITENENTFIINNELESNNSVTVVGKTNNLKDSENPALLNEISNNRMLDINTESDFGENLTLISNDDNLSSSSFKKKLLLTNGDLLLVSNDNKLFVVTKIINDMTVGEYSNGLVSIDLGSDIEINEFFQLKDTTLFIFTNTGIRTISAENLKNHTYTVDSSNIINGSFTTAHLNDEKTSFYAINNSQEASISFDTTNNKYKLTSFIYIYDINTQNIRDFKDYCSDYNLDDSGISADTNDELTELISGKTDGYAIIEWRNANKWLLLNKDTGIIYISKDEKFGNFIKSELISSKIPFVKLFSIDNYTGNVYLADKYVKAYTEIITGNYHYTEKVLTKVDSEMILPIQSIDYYKLTLCENLTEWDTSKTYYTNTDGFIEEVNTTTFPKPVTDTQYYTLEPSTDEVFDHDNYQYYYYESVEKTTNDVNSIPKEIFESGNYKKDADSTVNHEEVSPDIYELIVNNGEISLNNVKKAGVYLENNLNKFIRNVQLDCGSNMTGAGITANDIIKESTENLQYKGFDPVRIDGILYVPNEDIPYIVDINGYYYILVPKGKVIYKINHDKVLVGNIDLSNINIGDNTNIQLFTYKKALFVKIDNKIYVDKETLKVYSELFEDNNGVYIISNNKIISGYVHDIGGGGV